MNFYNEDEKKDGAAAPAAFKKTSSFGKAPLFSRTAGGLMDRLKNLSRKDMAFVGIGLSVLVMAPVAEYMMSKPSSDNLLTPGFGSREGGAPTGLYEPGINALSQGSPDGSGEVITPLSSRDPASLILGSQPAAPAMPPPAPPTTFRDSMKDVGRAAFSEASKAAPSPTPIPRMQAALRGMSSFFGGGDSTRTSGSLGGGKIIDDAKSASSKAAKRSMVGPVAMPGYKGVASNTPNSSSKGAFEKLRSAADKSAGNFSGGSAMSSLDKAAADAPTVGAGGGGMGYGGDSEKTGKTSPYNNKYEHSRSGESLAEMAAKQRMQKALDWEFFKQYEIPKMFINAIITGITGPLTKFVDSTMTHILGMNSPSPKCWVPFICPDGMCAKYIEEAKAKGVNPIKYTCEYAGAIKQKTVVGKESSAYSKDFCLCGEKDNPLFGANVEAGGVGNGGNGQIPQTDPPDADNPQGGAGGSQVSQNMAKLFTKYDEALLALMGRVIELESDLAKNQPETVLKPKVEGLANAFGTLDEFARGDVQKTLIGLKSQAEDAVTEYGKLYNARKERFSDLNTEYKDYTAAVKRIEADIKDKKLKPAVVDGIAADPVAAATAVAKLFSTHNETINTAMAGAEGLIIVHGKRYEAYTKQLQVVGGSISSLMGEHASVPAGAKAFLAAEGPLPEKLAAATGREPVAVEQAASEQPGKDGVAGAQTKGIDTAGGKIGKEAASAPQGEAPLKKAALKLRAVDDWDKMWEKKTFGCKIAGDKEEAEWKAYDKTVAGDSPADIASPGNFVANALRSGEIGTAAGDLTDLKKNITGMMDSAQVHMDTVKNSATARVHKCYFSKAGCSNVQETTGGGGQQLPASLTEAQKIRVNQAETGYKEAGKEYKAAKAQVTSMEAALPGTPYEEAKGEVAKTHAGLTASKGKLDEAKSALDAAVQSKDRKKVIAAADAYDTAQKEYNTAQAAFNLSYDRAAATPNGMKWTSLRNEANANFQTIMRCNNKCTNPTVCRAAPNASRVTEILSVAPNQLQLVEAAGTSDERRLAAAEGLRTGRATACMWVKKAMKTTVQGCP